MNERPDIREDTVANYMEVEYDFSRTLTEVHTFAATDYDGMDTFEWSLHGEDADHLDIGSTSGVLTFNQPSGICLNDGPLPDYEEPCDAATGGTNTYNVTVRATDDDTSNQKYSDYAVTITVTDVNERPDITEDTVDDYTEVDFYFDGTPADVHTFTAEDYDDGDTFEWSLSGNDAEDLEIGSSTGVLTFKQDASLMVGPLPSFENPQDQDEQNTYSITIVATDNHNKAGEYPVTITVTDAEEEGRVAAELPNDPPLVDDVLTFTLSDPDGGILLTSGDIDWIIEARVPADPPGEWEPIDVVDPLSLVKTYTVDEDHTGREMRATVNYEDRRGSGKEATSGESSSVQDERDVAPPRFRTGATQTIEEGNPGRDTEQEITATDRDGEALIFGIKQGPHSDLFEFVPSAETTMMNYGGIDYPEYTARLRAIEALDFETISTNPMVLTLTLSDGKEESNGRVIYDDTNDVDDFEVTITVTDVDEPGEITFSPEEVPEPGVEITASLADGDGSIGGQSWQWQRSEEEEDEEGDWPAIAGATSSTYTPSETDDVISEGDNEGKGYYLRATVTYADGEGGGKSATADAGQVGTANVRPQFPASETGQRSVDENSRAGTNIGEPVAAEDPENNRLTYSLTGFDAESFAIVSSTGQLRVREPLDFETGRTISIVDVNVHDRRDAAGSSSTYMDDTHQVIIFVENVEEPGTVTLTTDTGRVQATVPVTAELSDPDNPSGVTWQWARSSNRSIWEDIPGATSATYTPSVTTEGNPGDQGNYLRATVSYTGVDGSSDQSAEAVSSRVGDVPPTNSAPVFPDAEDGQREVREGTGGGRFIGDRVAATDFDGDSLTYTLSGSDATSFTIDGNTGQLQVELAHDETLDYERKRTYRFTVSVTDGKDQTGVSDNDRVDDTISVTVNVTDVNEAPVITGEADHEFRENGTSSVATYSARDPEGDTVSWSVDNSTFVITDRGQLYFNKPPSFEDGDTYQVTVTATDDDETGPLSASLNVAVTVTDLEEKGTVSIFPVRGWVVVGTGTEAKPEVQTRFTATLDDGDEPITNLSWQWSRSSSEPIEGATSDSYIATGDDVGRYLRVTATYRDNRSVDPMDPMDITEKTATASLRRPIGDTRPEMNAQPEFTVPNSEESAEVHFDTRTITSGTAAGRSIGARVSATDTDGDVLTYMLRGGDADHFDIDTATGQLRTKAALDYQDEDSYTVSVSVHDGFDALYRPSASIDDTISIIITVTPPPPPRRRVRRSTPDDDTPPNRPAEFSDGETTNRSVVQSAEAGTAVGRPVAASDPDGNTLSYTLGGTDAESFDIDAATGQLKTKAELNIETKSTYSVIVSVTDNRNAGGGRDPTIDDMITVTITVTSVELSEIVERYDADEDGLISRDEALAALNDFFDGTISRDQALEVIVHYFESPAVAAEILEENG